MGPRHTRGQQVSRYPGGEIRSESRRINQKMKSLRWWATGVSGTWKRARGVAGQRRRMIRFVRLRVEFVIVPESRARVSKGSVNLLPLGRFTGFVVLFTISLPPLVRLVLSRMNAVLRIVLWQAHDGCQSPLPWRLTTGGLCVSGDPRRRDFAPLAMIK